MDKRMAFYGVLLSFVFFFSACSRGPVPGMENGHEWVDLGLPSGLKWATCNVGADTPCDFGNYFCWAGVTPVIRDFENDILLGSEFVYFDRGAWRYTKYVTKLEGGIADNKYRLEPKDDAASVNWGGKWRMPTKADFIELKKHCKHKWVTENGVEGMQFISKKNGNSIFLPAAGCIDDPTKLGYWTSELNLSETVGMDDGSANCLLFSADGWLDTEIGSNRSTCFPVRPVTE